MTIFSSLLLGIIEGLTEFLPVSSTFHLLVTARILALPQSDLLKLFEVIVQGGAILSIIWLYGKRLFSSSSLQKHVTLSCLPTFTLGFVLYKLIKGYFFEAFTLQLVVFSGVGLMFIFYELYLHHHSHSLPRTLSDLTPRHALLIGLFQSLAVIPGVSRSGAILLGMLVLGYDRESSADYAFMLSLPTIFAATLLDLYKSRALLLAASASDIQFLVIGVIAAFFSALIVMKWLLSYLRFHTLNVFGYYRLVTAAILYWIF